jgi:ribonuclease R
MSYLDKIHDKPEKNLIETLVLRSMAKAKYATKNVGHYGLGFNYYSHFTSPIRRYPDLIVHRLINSFISKENYDISLDLDYISKHCSEMEKSAAIAERDSIKFMQIKFLNSKDWSRIFWSNFWSN